MSKATTSQDHRRAPDGAATFAVGSPVLVWCRFDGSWVEGFDIAEEVADEPDSYRVRRRYDDVLLPATFGADALRGDDHAPAHGAWVGAVH